MGLILTQANSILHSQQPGSHFSGKLHDKYSNIMGIKIAININIITCLYFLKYLISNDSNIRHTIA